MSTTETEKDENFISEHFPLADTPQERRAQYEQAVQLIEQFENQYSPKLTDYNPEDLTKVTIWNDEHGKRQYQIEEITVEEKEALEDAWEIMNIYEDSYGEEYLQVGAEFRAKDIQTEQALEDIQNIRHRNEAAPNRLQAFRANAERSFLEQQENKLPQEAETITQNELTDEQLQYIAEVEERAGIEFHEYEEAVEWERNEYGDDEKRTIHASFEKELRDEREMQDIREACDALEVIKELQVRDTPIGDEIDNNVFDQRGDNDMSPEDQFER